jgi:hypothetical protein
MATLTIQLPEITYQRLEKAAEQADKSIQDFIYEWINQLPEIEEPLDVAQDPVFQMEGYQ